MTSSTSTTWDRMTPAQKITAAHVDIMGHKEFALLSGVVCVGKAVYVDKLGIPGTQFAEELPTAATNGRDVYYNEKFMALQNRKQFRWVTLHENLHKAYRHCSEYMELVVKYPQLSNIAQDFRINGDIHSIDPQQSWAERPVGLDGKPLPIAFHEKYLDQQKWSWIAILQDLLRNAKQVKVEMPGGTLKGFKVTLPDGKEFYQFDEHIPGESEMTPEEQKELGRQIDDALRQGKIIVNKLAGNEKGNRQLDGMVQERQTNWQDPLRRFVEEACEGDEQSRYCPPNKRFLASGFVMPSHFAESTGELHIYCDTSGSMTGVYPTVFGEIARICETVRPKCVRVFWWDTACYEPQVFMPADYDQIKTLMKPAGGGGTHPECVVDHIRSRDYPKPKCGIWLTDGHLDGSNSGLDWPVLWGVVDNDSFVPPSGKVIRIDSNCM